LLLAVLFELLELVLVHFYGRRGAAVYPTLHLRYDFLKLILLFSLGLQLLRLAFKLVF